MMLLEQIVRIDRWLDTMRGPDGYGGPVVHWWQNSLQFTGAGIDWRYEGIIIGYLNLYRRTGNAGWLVKACRAGDDVVNGQRLSGSFRNSDFQFNPHSPGTPHESACDVALLQLALALQAEDNADWRKYAHAARRNLQEFYIGRLWDSDQRLFRDGRINRNFVPNKAASVAEAFLLLAEVYDDAAYAECYALPVLEHLLRHQVRQGLESGAFYQYSSGGRFISWFFPYYISRCMMGLMAGYAWNQDERFCESAQAALQFIKRRIQHDGSLPQVIYPGNRLNRYPQWVAGMGDVLTAAQALDVDLPDVRTWLLRGREATGGIRTGHGFGSQITQRQPGDLPDFRDILPVSGWVDKAWRYLTSIVPKDSRLPDVGIEPVEIRCGLRGQIMTYYEDETRISLAQGDRCIYLWRKGTPWAQVCEKELLWK